jgi:hypothetical protein
MVVNILIGSLTIYLLGMSRRSHNEVKRITSNTNTLNLKKSEIFHFLQTNCSKLFELFPEFKDFMDLQLCKQQEESMLIGKISILLSSLYQRCPSRLKSCRCRDGFQKNVSNFIAATVLDQKYWY